MSFLSSHFGSLPGTPFTTIISSVGKSRTTVKWNAMLAQAMMYSQNENQLNAAKQIKIHQIFQLVNISSLNSPITWHMKRCLTKNINSPTVLTNDATNRKRFMSKERCSFSVNCGFRMLQVLITTSMWLSEHIIKHMNIFSWRADKKKNQISVYLNY